MLCMPESKILGHKKNKNETYNKKHNYRSFQIDFVSNNPDACITN